MADHRMVVVVVMTVVEAAVITGIATVATPVEVCYAITSAYKISSSCFPRCKCR